MQQIVMPFVLALVLVAAVVLLTRLNGLRSSFGDPDDLPGGLATLPLFVVQAAITTARLRWRLFETSKPGLGVGDDPGGEPPPPPAERHRAG